MSSLTLSLRSAAALAACAFLAACAVEPAGQKAEAAPAPAPVVAASVAPAAVDAAATTIPAGFEALEVVTPKGATKFAVEIADNEAEREKGLMFRKSLAPDRGMLFDFHKPQPVAFWMRNTLIPLDIIYIQADGTILSIARNATPMSETPLPSGGPILGVLELAGGRAGEIGAMPGDKVVHRIFKK